MIKYQLKCAEGHGFESWFASGEAYESLARDGRLVCAVCGGGKVEKALMTPGVVASRDRARPPATTPPAPSETISLSSPASDIEAALAEFRARVEASTENVGARFADEARAIHEGRAPDRAIRGEAKLADAKALVEDGVPVLPLPFLPTRRVN